MKPTKRHIADVVDSFGALKFFPKVEDIAARKAVMQIIEAMVGSAAELVWLQEAMMNRVGEWQGPAELRGVFCAYHKPADGIQAYSTTPGFTQEDRNSRWMEKQGREIGQWGGDALEAAETPARAQIQGERDAQAIKTVLSDKALVLAKLLPAAREPEREASRLFIEKIYGPSRS